MEPCEPFDVLNKRLADVFGIDTLSGLPIWRIVEGEKQFEKQRVTNWRGIELPRPEVMEVPKYPWLQGIHILERLVIVPFQNAEDLPDSKIVYNVIWNFWDKDLKPLPAKWEVAELVINTVLAAQGKSSLARYVKSTEEEKAEQKKRIDDMIEYFSGDESGLMGNSLNSGPAAFVPHNYERSS
jgi:hypothetical protein